jgi:hypothetical protein
LRLDPSLDFAKLEPSVLPNLVTGDAASLGRRIPPGDWCAETGFEVLHTYEPILHADRPSSLCGFQSVYLDNTIMPVGASTGFSIVYLDFRCH